MCINTHFFVFTRETKAPKSGKSIGFQKIEEPVTVGERSGRQPTLGCKNLKEGSKFMFLKKFWYVFEEKLMRPSIESVFAMCIVLYRFFAVWTRL